MGIIAESIQNSLAKRTTEAPFSIRFTLLMQKKYSINISDQQVTKKEKRKPK